MRGKGGNRKRQVGVAQRLPAATLPHSDASAARAVSTVERGCDGAARGGAQRTDGRRAPIHRPALPCLRVLVPHCGCARVVNWARPTQQTANVDDVVARQAHCSSLNQQQRCHHRCEKVHSSARAFHRAPTKKKERHTHVPLTPVRGGAASQQRRRQPACAVHADPCLTTACVVGKNLPDLEGTHLHKIGAALAFRS
jgi:hypothetical protein